MGSMVMMKIPKPNPVVRWMKPAMMQSGKMSGMSGVMKSLPKQHGHAWGECVSVSGYIRAGLCFLHAHRSLGQIADEHQVHAEREPLSRRGLGPSGNGEADAAELQAGTYHTHQRTTGNEA